MNDHDADDHDHDADDLHTVHPVAAGLRDLLLANSRELRLISKQLHQLKEVVMSDQSTQAHLDSDVNKLRDEIKTELDAVKAANPSVNLSGLDKLVADNTAPAPSPAPAPASTSPGTPPADPTPASNPTPAPAPTDPQPAGTPPV